MTSLKRFLLWLDIPIEQVTSRTISQYIDALMSKRRKPKTINCHLQRIREFYHYLIQEEALSIPNPVKKGYSLRTGRPLPKHLPQEQVDLLLSMLKTPRDRAMFLLMLRCGLRVSEVAGLSLSDIDLPQQRLLIRDAKWGKDRVVYVSGDATGALLDYLKVRPPCRTDKLFLNQKGPCQDEPLSIRGIQKRMEYYANKTGLTVCCHHLRHTMATQMLNADAELVTIQDLLGHSWITTTQRYCRVSNRKVEKDYYKAMEMVMKRTTYHYPGTREVDIPKV